MGSAFISATARNTSTWIGAIKPDIEIPGPGAYAASARSERVRHSTIEEKWKGLEDKLKRRQNAPRETAIKPPTRLFHTDRDTAGAKIVLSQADKTELYTDEHAARDIQKLFDDSHFFNIFKT